MAHVDATLVNNILGRCNLFVHVGQIPIQSGHLCRKRVGTPAAWQDQGARMTVIALANAVKSHRTKTFVSSSTS